VKRPKVKRQLAPPDHDATELIDSGQTRREVGTQSQGSRRVLDRPAAGSPNSSARGTIPGRDKEPLK